MNRRLTSRFTILLVIVLLLINCSDDDSVTPPVLLGGEAKVVGYLPYYRFDLITKIEYCKLTHLNLAFANPDADGNLIIDDFSTVIDDARADNPDIVICISIAGGAISPELKQIWSDLIDIPGNRPDFIAKIVDFVLQNDLDGVDVDLEWDLVTSGYSGFVLELNTALDAHNKILTAALPATTRYSNATDAALAAFDFINIMAYDATGPWMPEVVGPHSSYQFAKSGINFWKNTVDIPSDKLTLGVPFYGYDFSTSPVTSFTYGQLVKNDSNLADLDQNGLRYYNGRPTIEAKVEMAAKDVAGIMIWEIGQDSFDQYSLLSTIHNKFTELGVKTSKLCGNH
ncbi:glycosyl hydrolase family 18 protein [Aureibaculum conchae]|uniref:glycosyl hydrolase family 18 protein n=1 Tax=Aureibaculum sp. 2308TA14-22 TaxID=3108392 RepID=UPI003390F5B5